MHDVQNDEKNNATLSSPLTYLKPFSLPMVQSMEHNVIKVCLSILGCPYMLCHSHKAIG